MILRGPTTMIMNKRKKKYSTHFSTRTLEPELIVKTNRKRLSEAKLEMLSWTLIHARIYVVHINAELD